jgi:hypothetical protein
MLENIARYVEQGEDPFRAAPKGSREIAFAVIAMTITLAAVYAPVAFQTGSTGRLFAEFALTDYDHARAHANEIASATATRQMPPMPVDNSGSAYVFRRGVDGSWSELATLTHSGSVAGDAYGWAVATDGQWAMVGSIGYDQPMTSSGAVAKCRSISPAPARNASKLSMPIATAAASPTADHTE